MSKKIKRNLSTPEGRKFWAGAEKIAAIADVKYLPWKFGSPKAHPMSLDQRIQQAAQLGCGLELSSAEVKKLKKLLTK